METAVEDEAVKEASGHFSYLIRPAVDDESAVGTTGLLHLKRQISLPCTQRPLSGSVDEIASRSARSVAV